MAVEYVVLQFVSLSHLFCR